MIPSRAILAGAISGFVSAFLVDLHAWSQDEDGIYNWTLAAKRWVAGAVSGAAAAAGLGAM